MTAEDAALVQGYLEQANDALNDANTTDQMRITLALAALAEAIAVVDAALA